MNVTDRRYSWSRPSAAMTFASASSPPSSNAAPISASTVSAIMPLETVTVPGLRMILWSRPFSNPTLAKLALVKIVCSTVVHCPVGRC